MYWQEDDNKEEYQIPDDVIDVHYQITAPTLPVDHAEPLQKALQSELPWFNDNEPQMGLHLIHTADTGNGWERPTDPDALLHLSKRTKLKIRIPKAYLEEAKELCGKTINVAGHPIQFNKQKILPLAKTTILFSRYVAVDPEQDENDFIIEVVDFLKNNRLNFKKIMAGMQHSIRTDDKNIFTRSLMIADLPLESAVYLQQYGYGKYRTLGCGLFIPQKTM